LIKPGHFSGPGSPLASAPVVARLDLPDVRRDEDDSFEPGESLDEAAVVAENLHLVRSIASNVSRRVPNADVDDLVGDGLVGLLSAVRSWDPFRSGMSLTPWAVTFVRRAMIDGVRAARGRRWRVPPASLDREIDEHGDTAVNLLVDEVTNIEDIVVARELTDRILALEPRRRFVLVARGRGLTDAETGSFLGISSSGVRELAIDACRKLAA
jgi:RNA polymerase sigma factor (sigma-70 family)